MIDWSAEIVEKYELEVVSSRKGRGSWIFETDHGLKLLKEYKGSVKRLEFEEAVLDTMKEARARPITSLHRASMVWDTAVGVMMEWPWK